MSDESEGPRENQLYYKKYKLLLNECENIQKHNERLVYRINAVKKITRRRLEQSAYLKRRLKLNYGEDWTEIPLLTEDNVLLPEKTAPKKTKKAGARKARPQKKRSQVGNAESSAAVGGSTDESSPKKPKTRTKRTTRRDPLAPKRPSNPFFQFCQEQRQPLMEQLLSQLVPGQVEPNKQELTRQLALKWKTLTANEKQVYVNMYVRSKERYAAEMTEYNMRK